jgi:metal-responsive CopG/Arc/MetJ family transcriptional regulator
MLDVMTIKKSAGEKIAVNARIDKDLVDKLDELAKRQGTVEYERSRSELVGFAVREYVERRSGKGRSAEKK